AAVERRDRQEIQHREVHANHSHQLEELRYPLLGGTAGFPRDSKRPLQLLQGNISAEQFHHDIDNLPDHHGVRADGLNNGLSEWHSPLHHVTALDLNANLPLRNAVLDAGLLWAHFDLKVAIAAP